MADSIIDVSHWQDPIDFAKLRAAGIVAVIAKATQGNSGVDPTYAKNKANAAPHGLLWGSYHFGTGDDVSAQVDHYLKLAQPQKNEFVCLDFESNPKGSTMTIAQAREFIGLFQQATGRLPVLYGGYWLKECLAGKTDDLLANCPLWIAEYGPKVGLPPGWNGYTLWQFSESEQGIPGVGRTDRSRFDGTDEVLAAKWPFT